MRGIELLNNKGIRYIGDENTLAAEEKTLIVVGVARGGTSLIAGSLDHLGVFTGEGSNPPVFEDVNLANEFESNDLQSAKQIIEAYNNDHKIWAFKRPSSIDYLNHLNSLCRNPIYLFVFKDIFSISNRNNISMKLDTVQGLKKAHNDYAKILDFIEEKEINSFLFSYEKVMDNKEFFIDTLIDVLGKENIGDEEKTSALNFIEPNPKAYLNASRITRSIGTIGRIEKNRVVGWGKYLHSDKPVEVELYINDKLIETKTAHDFRQHLLDSKKHPTGNCGYVFNLESQLQDGDKVAVKLSDDVVYLNGSDHIFKEVN